MTVPVAPTAFALTFGVGKAKLNVAGDTSGATAYDYQVATNSGFTTGLVTYTLASSATVLDAVFNDLLPNTTYFARVRGHNASGYGSYAATLSGTTPVRTFLDMVEGASVSTPNGTICSLRSDGNTPGVISIGYSAVAGGTTWTSIATVPTGVSGTAGSFLNPTDVADLALVSDSAGNLYVIGKDAAASGIRVMQYLRTGTTNAWTLGGTLAQVVTDGFSTDLPSQFAAVYVPGSGGSPVDTIAMITKYYGVTGAINNFSVDAAVMLFTLSIPAVTASSGTLVVAGNQLISSTSDTRNVELAVLPGTSTLVFSGGGTKTTYTAPNGVLSFTSSAFPSLSSPLSATSKLRIIPISSTLYSIAYVSSSTGALVIDTFSNAGTRLGTATYAATNFGTGAIGAQWDAYYDRVTGQIVVYYISSASTITLAMITYSPTLYTFGSASNVSTAFGAAGTVTSQLRVSHGTPVDERHVLIEGASVLTGTQSLTVYSDTSGNVTPSAPTLTTRSPFDATAAAIFAWTFGDSNPEDTQTAYQLQILNASTLAVVYDTGTVASSSQSATVPANSLVNSTAYKWQVRTTDVLGAVSAYSAQGAITPTAIGTLAITAPAADDPAGVNTSSYALTWSYTQPNGFTQVQARVLVQDAATGLITYSDTGMVASTTLGYTVTSLPSGVRVKITVSLINSNGESPTPAVRYLTTNYTAPMTPTFTTATGPDYNTIAVANPAPTGSQPATDHNVLYRRVTGSGSPFAAIAAVAVNGAYNDHAVKSGVAYDYYVVAEAVGTFTTASSTTASVTSPLLTGIWAFDILNPDATAYNFQYGSGRTVTAAVDATMFRFAGRAKGTVEYGEDEQLQLALTIPIPVDQDQAASVQWWVTEKNARSTLCYRDNRGRLLYIAIDAGIQIADQTDGSTIVSGTFDEVDYSVTVS